VPVEAKLLSVFIASPGGLDKERSSERRSQVGTGERSEKFIEVLGRRNDDEGHESRVLFLPRGQEFAYGGMGRAQGLINEQIEKSDFLVVILWDHWGSAPDDDGTYSSGTEEEFYQGLECLHSDDHPMRDIVVFFKEVDDRQMRDPGKQLSRVLDFRNKLEDERLALYRTFSDLESLADELRRTVSKWSRELTTGQRLDQPKEPRNDAYSPGVLEQDMTQEELVEAAREAAKAGRSTIAHQLFSRATTGAYDRHAWTEYVRFLRRSDRLGLMFNRASDMIGLASDAGDPRGVAEAYSNIGIAKRNQGNRSVAIDYFDQALKATEDWQAMAGDLDEVVSMRAFILDNKGMTWRRMPGKLPDALDAIEEAIELHGRVGDAAGKAHGLRNIGVVRAQLGDIDSSLSCLAEAQAIFEELEQDRALAMTLSSIGETLTLKGDYVDAISHFELALQKNTALGNHQGKSMNLTQLARTYAQMGDLASARENAEACVAQNQRTGNKEGLAAALHVMGRVELEAGHLNEARQYLDDALESFQDLDQPAGIAGAAIDLATTLHRLGELDAARVFWETAQAALDRSPHYGLQGQLDRLSEQLRPEQP